MFSRSTRALLVAVLLLGAFLWLFERRTLSPDLQAGLGQRVVPLDAELVTRLAISTPQFSLSAERRDAHWYLTAPVTCRADAAAVRRIVEVITNLRREEVIDARRRTERGLTLESYGLEQPGWRVRVGTATRQDEIAVGIDAPLGDSVYVRVNEDETVIATSATLREALPASWEALRDRRLFGLEPQRVVRVAIKQAGAGFVQLARRDGEWRMQQPWEVPASAWRVGQWLRVLAGLQAEAFVEPGREGVDPATYGLTPEEAELQVSAWTAAAQEPFVLLVGKPREDDPTRRYAQTSDGASIALVSSAAVAGLKVKPRELRDNRVCPVNVHEVRAVLIREGEQRLTLERGTETGWAIWEPLRGTADEDAVHGLLRALVGLRAVDFLEGSVTNGMPVWEQTAHCRITLAKQVLPADTNAPAGSGRRYAETLTLRFSEYASGAERAIVVQEESGVGFSVATAEMTQLASLSQSGTNRLNLADPRLFLERTVLRVGPENLRRVTLTRQGVEETAMRDESGNWVVESPPEGRINEAVFAELLAAIDNLRAVRVESTRPERLAAYGLEEPAVRLSLGLTGTGAIQKTLLLGGNAAGGGVYAMVQGRDNVFVLEGTVATRLSRSFVIGP